jgi:hypothetical protein
MLVGRLPGRYREIVAGVLARLPDGWDYYRTVSFAVLETKPERGYASCLREEALESSDDAPAIEGHHEQCWTVSLYTPWLDRMSEAAVAWVVAHELGHVASGMACGELVLGGRPFTRIVDSDDQYREITPAEKDAGEKIADAIARAWGFWIEEEAFEEECGT